MNNKNGEVSKMKSDLTQWQEKTLNRLRSLRGSLNLNATIGSGRSLVSLLAPLYVPECRCALLIVEPTLVLHFLDLYQRAEPPLTLFARGEVDAVRQVSGAPAVYLATPRVMRPSTHPLLPALRPDLVIVHDAKDVGLVAQATQYARTTGARSLIWWLIPGAVSSEVDALRLIAERMIYEVKGTISPELCQAAEEALYEHSFEKALRLFGEDR